MSVKLLTKHNLEFLIVKGGCTGSSDSTLVKMPLCWKSHVAAHLCSLHSHYIFMSVFNAKKYGDEKSKFLYIPDSKSTFFQSCPDESSF